MGMGGLMLYGGFPEKWHRQAFEQSYLFKGLEKKYDAIFWGSGCRMSLCPCCILCMQAHAPCGRKKFKTCEVNK